MGNALEAAKFSILQGNTGVATKKTLLEGIDNFDEGVQTWKDNIDAARLKLKTDTASKYREAEKEVYENLPSDKTDRDLALKALASYKDQLYGNMGLVQAGMIKPEDNLIFQENGKQSFEILANQINEYAKRREETLKRSKGYYETNEDGSQKLDAQGKPIYVPPASGAYEASLQDLQSRMGNPEFTNVTFGENGMAKVTFYKTEVDELTGTRVLVKDADGNPIPIDGLKDMSVLSFDRGRNQRADRLDLQTNVMNVVGPNTALGQTFDTMSKNGLLLGTIEDNQRANPQLKVMIDDGVSTLTSTPDRIVSILSDNGPQSQQSIPVNVAQWDGLTDAQRKETVSYTWTDASGNQQTGTKSKYIKLVTSANGQIVPELSQKDREAAENIARTTIYSSLKKDITDKGTKRTEFDPYRESKGKAKKETAQQVGKVDFAKRLALGGEEQEKALEEMRQSGLYTREEGFNQILNKTEVKEVEVGGQKREAEVYTVQTPNGQEEMYVFHTDKGGNTIPLEERTRQTLSILMTNPTETKDLFDTYKGEGNTFDETYKKDSFSARNDISTVSTTLSLDSTVSGTGAKKITLNDGLTGAIKTADKDSSFGFTGSVLASGVEENLTQALLNSNQELQSSPKVRFDKDKELMTITAVNNKGKTITITRTINDESNGEAQKVRAMVTEFLSNINSDEDYTSGKGKYD
jgi:hypothetical protein